MQRSPGAFSGSGACTARTSTALSLYRWPGDLQVVESHPGHRVSTYYHTMSESKKNKPRESMSLAAFAAQLPEATATVQDERRLVGKELRERVEELFGAVPVPDGAPLAVAWRVVRALAAAQGHVADREVPLSVVPDRAWAVNCAGSVQGHAEGTAPWIREAAEAQLPLLPHTLLERQDGAGAARYIEVAGMIARHLGVRRSRELRLGLDALGDLEAWPSRWALVALEDALVLHTYTVATTTPAPDEEPGAEVASEAKAARMLRAEFHLSQPEVDSVLAMARRRALETLPESIEAMRALQLAALEDAARRAGQTLDMRSEAAFRRLIVQTAGLTRTAPEDAMRDFIDVVRRVSSRRELPEPQRPALPPRHPESEFVAEQDDDTGEEDREALEAYDREN